MSDLPQTPAAPRRRAGSRLRLAAALILAGGLLAAAAVWVEAGDDVTAAPGYQIVGGQAFAVPDSAAADRQTERLGGRALVRTAAFDRWLGSLWHGRRLACVLAVVSVGVALACLWIAGPTER